VNIQYFGDKEERYNMFVRKPKGKRLFWRDSYNERHILKWTSATLFVKP
jgi:hypothetical protein